MWFPLTSTTKIFWESSKNCTFKCSILGEAVGLRAGSECCECCDRKGAFSRNFTLSWRQCAQVPPPPSRHPPPPTAGHTSVCLNWCTLKGMCAATCWWSIASGLSAIWSTSNPTGLTLALLNSIPFFKEKEEERKHLQPLGIFFISQEHDLKTLDEALINWEKPFSKVKGLKLVSYCTRNFMAELGKVMYNNCNCFECTWCRNENYIKRNIWKSSIPLLSPLFCVPIHPYQ